ncbi:hypothetical protein A3I42_02520 [Candidatus Uhrbacteria bacterium RIFCSPLOWO2_02_FULL_49_11]|uniref:50S ribosomal protein L7/L12 n=1 Tax=Candidatus Uhrbacteria bacterium RIFCSPLOWO2_02_FULL_49_11 TaxID=1802409 RepID=A0A1F7VBH5_9BACT|nr:MAG: hypothetical protein A3I42_02520 [Candidatus Uhrbacteria bacterium RIFCSPLOWO2_02_FULL_49_11]
MPHDVKKIELVRQYVESASLSLQEAKQLLEDMTGVHATSQALEKARAAGAILASSDGSDVIEGVFDGQQMVGPDGKQYSMPANYASKSKLVEGDLLKLTIAPNGSFIYKQIGPVERKRLRGKLIQEEETGEFRVLAEARSYKTLMASITYFKGNVGDDVVILVPRDKVSSWAAVENIISAGSGDFQDEPIGEGKVGEKASQEPKDEEEEEEEEDLEPEEPKLAPPQKEELLLKVEPKPELNAPQVPLVVPPQMPAPAPVIQFDDDKDEFEEI